MKKLYNEHLPLIKDRTNYFFKQNKYIEYEEMFSEACLAFVESYHSYDKSKSKFSTHLHNRITYKLQTLIINENKRLNIISTVPEIQILMDLNIQHNSCHIKEIILKDQINNLPKKEKKIVNIILNPNKSQKKKPKISMNSLLNYLVGIGWKYYDVKRAFHTLRREFA